MMRRTILFSVALSMLLSCSVSRQDGPSSFVLDEVDDAVMFTKGQTVLLAVDCSNIITCTAKAPKGWKATASSQNIIITAPDITEDYTVNGQVGVYARGADNKEYAYNIPVRCESNLSKNQWSIAYCSSETEVMGPASYIIDGSYQNYWLANDQAGDKSPYYIVIDMGEEHTLSSFDLWGIMPEGEVAASMPERQCAEMAVDFASKINSDGMADLGGKGSGDWHARKIFRQDVLRNVEHNFVALDEPVVARYVRMHYRRMWTEAGVSSVGTIGGGLAEIDIYGF